MPTVSSPAPVSSPSRRRKKDAPPADVRMYHIGVAAKRGDPPYAAIWTESGTYVRTTVTSRRNAVYTPRVVGASIERVVEKMASAFPDAIYQQNADAERDAQTQYDARNAARKEGKS